VALLAAQPVFASAAALFPTGASLARNGRTRRKHRRVARGRQPRTTMVVAGSPTLSTATVPGALIDAADHDFDAALVLAPPARRR
jgi:hypothetical protein